MADTAGTRSLRALEIVEFVARSPKPVSVAEVVSGLDLPRPTAHRLIALLLEERFLQRDVATRRLVVSARVLSFGMAALTRPDIRGARRAVLNEVAERTQETINLSMPDGDAMVYVDRVETDWPLRLQFPIGGRVPLYCTAGGKLYLSQMHEEARMRLIHGLQLTRHTPNTITDPLALNEAAKRIARSELGLDDEELLQGMVAAAVPIRDGRGHMLAALAVQAPVARFSLSDLKRFEGVLREGAAKLSGILAPDNTPDAMAADTA